VPETMRAARYHGPGDSLRLEKVPVPRPGPGEALVPVRAAGAIRATIDRMVPLEDVNRVVDDLRQGKVVGRAVVTP
jgi:D-arabinose 1-dehydrogenase-like Zn-dependent alcohol dehydrogenase